MLNANIIDSTIGDNQFCQIKLLNLGCIILAKQIIFPSCTNNNVNVEQLIAGKYGF